MATTTKPTKYFKGHSRRSDKDHLIQLSHVKHGARLKQLSAQPLPSTWDSRTRGWVGPIKSQGQCGSCWDFSGTGIIEIAFNKAGIGGGAGAFILSEQYTLSCCKNGQCNGDDNTTVLDEAQVRGLPLTSDYGPYAPPQENCLYQPGMQLFQLDGWGFVDSNGGAGVPSTDDIKSAIINYGAVGCGVSADAAFQNSPAGTVFTGSGATTIDHDVILVGWDDGTNSWILRNSWDTTWCNQGYMQIAYGANCVGSEAVWAVKHGGAP